MSDWIPMVARMIVGLVLVVAGVGKLRSQTWPALAVEMGTPKLVVLTLPAAESMLGIALLIQIGGPLLAWPTTALFVAFTAVVSVRYLRGTNLQCNCFGGDEMITRWTIGRNMGLVLLALLGTF